MSNEHVHHEPTVWGPATWTFLHTTAFTYPEEPDEVAKRNYYTFFHGLAPFLPDPDAQDLYAKLLHQFPVSAYLDSRKSLVRWVHFIHNRVNDRLEKPRVGMDDFLQNHKLWNVAPNVHTQRYIFWKNNLVYAVVVAVLIVAAVLAARA
jgi:hypothetical protein